MMVKSRHASDIASPMYVTLRRASFCSYCTETQCISRHVPFKIFWVFVSGIIVFIMKYKHGGTFEHLCKVTQIY